MRLALKSYLILGMLALCVNLGKIGTAGASSKMITFNVLENKGTNIDEQVLDAIKITVPVESIFDNTLAGGNTYSLPVRVRLNECDIESTPVNEGVDAHKDDDYDVLVVIENRSGRFKAAKDTDPVDMADAFYEVREKELKMTAVYNNNYYIESDASEESRGALKGIFLKDRNSDSSEKLFMYGDNEAYGKKFTVNCFYQDNIIKKCTMYFSALSNRGMFALVSGLKSDHINCLRNAFLTVNNFLRNATSDSNATQKK